MINVTTCAHNLYIYIYIKIRESGSIGVNLDCRNLMAYPDTHKLYDQLIKYPQEIIPLMDHTITNFYMGIFEDANLNGQQLKVKKNQHKQLLNIRVYGCLYI